MASGSIKATNVKFTALGACVVAVTMAVRPVAELAPNVPTPVQSQ